MTEEQIYLLISLVNKQASDDGIWVITENIVEEFLKMHIRFLHAIIENKDPYWIKKAKEYINDLD